MSSGLVVVAAAADGVSRPSCYQQYQADDEQDDPEDQNDVGEGEGRDEAREEVAEDDKDDSGNDHDIYLVSSLVRKIRGKWGGLRCAGGA
jgi:hypothetical protein